MFVHASLASLYLLDPFFASSMILNQTMYYCAIINSLYAVNFINLSSAIYYFFVLQVSSTSIFLSNCFQDMVYLGSRSCHEFSRPNTLFLFSSVKEIIFLYFYLFIDSFTSKVPLFLQYFDVCWKLLITSLLLALFIR